MQLLSSNTPVSAILKCSLHHVLVANASGCVVCFRNEQQHAWCVPLPAGVVVRGLRQHHAELSHILVFGGEYIAMIHSDATTILLPATQIVNRLEERVMDATSSRLDPHTWLIGTSCGRIVKYNTTTCTVTNIITTTTTLSESLHVLRFTPCRDDEVAVASFNTIRVRRIESMTPSTSTIHAHVGAIFALAWNSDSTHLASGGEDRSVRVHSRVDNQFTLLWSSLGSRGRIWDLAWWSNGVVSVGEDAIIRVWKASNGQVVGDLFAHSIKNVWCCHVLDDVLTTGGASGVKQWDLAPPSSTTTTTTTTLSGLFSVFTCSYPIFKLVAITLDWRLTIVMEHGPNYHRALAVPDLHHSDMPTCICAYHSEHDIIHVCIGTKRGRVMFYCVVLDPIPILPPPVFPIHQAKLSRDVSCMHWLTFPGCLPWFFAGSGDGSWLVFDNNNIITSHLPNVNSSVKCACATIIFGVIVVGDSLGRLYMYDCQFPAKPLYQWHRAHGLEAVTAIHGFSDGGRMVSIAENGVLIEFRVTRQFGFEVIAEYNKLGPLTRLHSICVANTGMELLVVGSVGEDMYLWDVKRSHAVVRYAIPTRRFHHFMYGNDGQWTLYTIATNKSIEVTKFALERVGRDIVRHPGMVSFGHSRIVWAVSCISNSPYVVTASEDELLCIWRIHGASSTLVARCDAHVASVRCLDVLRQNEKVYIVSGGAHCVLAVTEFDLLTESLQLLAISRHEEMDDDVSSSSSSRIMCIQHVRFGTFVAGTADGRIRLYNWKQPIHHHSETKEDSTPLQPGRRRRPKNTHAVTILRTRCEIVLVREYGHGVFCVLAMKMVAGCVIWGDTNGMLAGALCDGGDGEMSSIRVHQCGTNAIDTITRLDGTVMIVCGGDDQSLAVCRMTVGSPPMLVVHCVFPLVVASAIVGVSWIGPHAMLVASADQRLTYFLFDDDGGLRKTIETVVGVAQPCGLSICWSANSDAEPISVAVCGEGWAMYDMKDNEICE